MALPTTRANVAMAIAANQYAKAKQQNPNEDPQDTIDNLQAVPSVIKDFLKSKVSGGSFANLQTGQDNPLMQQHQIYQQMTNNLVKPFAPQMSQGRAVAGLQLPPDKALTYLHSDPNFQQLPKEYQDYAIGVIGGQDALNLHQNTLTAMRRQSTDQVQLQQKAAENNLQFANSPTKMVQHNLEEGRWYVDSAANKLMKRQKNPVTGMDENLPLEPWEAMHMINESPKLGYGDMSRFLNPQQQAGLAALRSNPDANTADIIKAVTGGQKLQASPNQLSTIAGMPNQIPEATRGDIPGQIANLQTLSPERIATMRMLGYQLPDVPSSPSGSPSVTMSPDEHNAQVLARIGASQRKSTPIGSPAGYSAGQNIIPFLSGQASNVGNFVTDRALPFAAATGQNALSFLGRGAQAVTNFSRGIRGAAPDESRPEIPYTNPGDIRPAINNVLNNQLPDWLVNSGAFNTDQQTSRPVGNIPLGF